MEYGHNQKGMTLVEVLAALVLLSLVTICLFTMVTTSSVWVFKAGQSTQAMTMANTIMEDIKANSFAIPTGVFDRNMLQNDVADGGLGLSFDYGGADKWANLAPEVIIDNIEFEGSSTDNLLQVTVKVSWQEQGREFHNQVISVISRR